jgi:hypothetical protein
LLGLHGWRVAGEWRERCDLELLCLPGQGRFGNRSDCRILAVFDEACLLPAGAGAGQIVLSPSGQIGRPGQARLRLDDVAGLWSVLNSGPAQSQRAAA